MLDIALQIVLGVLSLGILVAFVRLILGPDLQDRVVSLDLIAVLAVGIIVTVSTRAGEPALLDAATVIALVGFLGTVAYAWYVEKEAQ